MFFGKAKAVEIQWTFFGRVHPERVPIHWDTPLSGRLSQPDLGITAEFRTIIHASQIIVDIKVLKGTADVDSLRNIAAQCAHGITDLVGYRSGSAFTVEIIAAIRRDTDEWRIFGIEIPALVARSNPIRSAEIDGNLLSKVALSVPASMVLSDFQNAMRVPIGTGFYCYRAIEAMVQSIKDNAEESSKKAWPRLRALLHIDEPVLRYIETHAAFPRHGRPSSITEVDRSTIYELTDEIIQRYLEFLVRGGKEGLPTTEFAVLKLPT